MFSIRAATDRLPPSARLQSWDGSEQRLFLLLGDLTIVSGAMPIVELVGE
jgi:hypothetical protein